MSSALLRVAYAYDRLRAHPPEVAGQIATAMASAVHPKGEEPVFLELGVGTGRIALPLIARGYRYIALDADAAMLEVFRQKIAGVDRKVQVVQADARAIPLPDESVHGVIVVHLWHLVPDWPKVLAEAIRVLKPLGDRGTLVESQRLLAQVLLGQGRLDDAERFALELERLRMCGGHQSLHTSRSSARSATGSAAHLTST